MLMLQLRITKLVAVFLIGMTLGLYVYRDEVRWAERGRDAFLVFQTQRFSRTVMHPHHLLSVIFTGVLATAAFIGLYELLSAGLGKVIPGPKA